MKKGVSEVNILIAGGTGFIGQKLSELLLEEGHNVFVLTREEVKKKNGITYIKWMYNAKPEIYLPNIDAFVNLAGVSLNEKRWTNQQKKKILQSRIDTTDECFRIIKELEQKPNVFINASAIGIYPISKTNVYTEESKKEANDFLGTVVKTWEQHASQIARLGIRTCYTRFGVVLGNNDGALPRMVLPYKLYAGGTIGSGNQWLSWIHVEDLVRALLYIMKNDSIEGVVNLTAPNPKCMKAFGKSIGQVMKRPHWLPVPSLALRLALGEQSILVLEGQYVMPEKLLLSNFNFKYTTLSDALEDLLT